MEEEKWGEKFDEFYDEWCNNPENTPTLAYIELSPNEVKSLYKIMKETFFAAIQNCKEL